MTGMQKMTQYEPAFSMLYLSKHSYVSKSHLLSRQEGFRNLHLAGPLCVESGPVAMISALRRAGLDTVTRQGSLFLYHRENIFVLHLLQKW
jgi:hypothetical protein